MSLWWYWDGLALIDLKEVYKLLNLFLEMQCVCCYVITSDMHSPCSLVGR